MGSTANAARRTKTAWSALARKPPGRYWMVASGGKCRRLWHDAPISMMKQISRVLDAVENGATTSLAVAAATGLSVPACSAYLKDLESCGAVRRAGTVKFSGPGRRCITWKQGAKP
jgi:hypothetical protein